MTFSIGEFKKTCKENGFALRAGLFGVSKNDSGKCDFTVEVGDTCYCVKVFAVGDGAERVYFKNAGGYVTVKCADASSDFVWVKPAFESKHEAGKNNVDVLLLDNDVPSTYIAKNMAVTVTAGASVFGCKVYTPTEFVNIIRK